jgi:2-polyprenyl-6-methoxyphenol hydroxylase-like FAD-dependent oxidoreductase
MVMQTWRSDEDTGLIGHGKEALKLGKWREIGRDFGPPFREIFETIEPSSPIWHNRLGYWPTKPWDSKGLVTLVGDAAHPMTFRKRLSPSSVSLLILCLTITLYDPIIDQDSDRGQGLNYAITDAAELLQQLRGMTERTGTELAAAVKRYEAELFPRGKEGVISSNENTNAVHDWVTMMESPLFKEGLRRAGDQSA